jgi:peroxiredoxin
MAQAETVKLDSGSAFPEMELRLVDGSEATIPKDFRGNWLVFLAYRGHW